MQTLPSLLYACVLVVVVAARHVDALIFTIEASVRASAAEPLPS
jgi:hypothetical protein